MSAREVTLPSVSRRLYVVRFIAAAFRVETRRDDDSGRDDGFKSRAAVAEGDFGLSHVRASSHVSSVPRLMTVSWTRDKCTRRHGDARFYRRPASAARVPPAPFRPRFSSIPLPPLPRVPFDASSPLLARHTVADFRACPSGVRSRARACLRPRIRRDLLWWGIGKFVRTICTFARDATFQVLVTSPRR